jgi:hypothetical protein
MLLRGATPHGEDMRYAELEKVGRPRFFFARPHRDTSLRCFSSVPRVAQFKHKRETRNEQR